MFVPGACIDRLWVERHAARIGELGIFVFRHPALGVALFVEGDGFDEEEYRGPLHRLRQAT